MFLVGAGISVSAGIPDFRSEGTGFYEKIKKMGLEKPEMIFDIKYFAFKPETFYSISKDMFFFQEYEPTITHYFMKLMMDKGNLQTVATQNIDSLELKAGIDANKLVQAHGHYNSAHCISGHKADIAMFKKCVFEDKIYECETCGSPVKPDVVFFGEMLPPSFFELRDVKY